MKEKRGLRTEDRGPGTKIRRALPGTLDLLVLRALAWEPTHGTGVGDWIRLVTGGVLTIEEGSLYPALGRLERKGWITSDWGQSERNRRARYYQLTPCRAARNSDASRRSGLATPRRWGAC